MKAFIAQIKFSSNTPIIALAILDPRIADLDQMVAPLQK
jgi:hypothetical protein